MGSESLEIAKMREAINTQVRRHQILNRTADSQKISEFINPVIFENEHEARQPDQCTANIQRQKRLDIPCSYGDVPNVPGCFCNPQNDRKRPTDGPLCVLSGSFKSDEIEIEGDEKCQRGDMSNAEQLKSGTGVIACKELTHEILLGSLSL